jgi:hypothetical protein
MTGKTSSKYDVQYPLTLLEALDNTISQVQRAGPSKEDQLSEAYYIDINGKKIVRRAGWGQMAHSFWKKRLGYLKALRKMAAELEVSGQSDNEAGARPGLEVEESRQQQD